ncbi:MAG TPA: DUF5060 domain-containing protein [Chthonomonadaceae bacterium]|nr:DUF5060 domain-containing protein [Chthonomonadaceae bacterium]
MRTLRTLSLMLPIALLALGGAARVHAQAASTQAQVVPGNRIAADSPAYRIEWDGASGVFVRKALGPAPESRQPLAYLHTDAGPTGVAKNLVWFLARQGQAFTLLWCYMNPAGTEFDSWMYNYPLNVLTPVHFSGTYQFTPPAEPVPAAPMPAFTLPPAPAYSGPSFTFQNWTKTFGGLGKLDLKATRQSAAPPASSNTGDVTKTVSQLLVRPLHEVDVPAANGWREGGWRELHALATDSTKDPYYLILYSNSPTGYVVDLKRAQLYTTDFGGRVAFEGTGQGGPQDIALNTAPEIKVRRYDRYEITLKADARTANPYVDSPVGIEFHTPDAKSIVVPGFWDGGNTFRIRIVPTIRGVWTWKSVSAAAPDLDGKTGAFECVGEDPAVKGFVNVQPAHKNPHHFSYSNGDAFLPAAIREPQPEYTALSGGTASRQPDGSGVRLAAVQEAAQETAPADNGSFIAYQRFVNAAAAKGFTRLIGGALLGPARTGTVRANEGGPAFINSDLGTANPAFFQAMDRRVAYCNAHGIVPDIGVGVLEDALFAKYNPAALYRLWGYIVARYSAYDVQWSLFTPGATAPSAAALKGAEQFAELTRLYDTLHHPLTITMMGVSAPAAPPAPATETTRTTSRTGAALSEPPKKAVAVPYDVASEDLITALGGDINALPSYFAVNKPVELIERPTAAKDALSPDAARRRMWETRMRGAYYAPGTVPTLEPDSLNAPDLQYAAYCAALFRRTRFYRLVPREDMLGGPAESAADKRRRKRAEAAAAVKTPPPTVDPADIDPFAADPFANVPAPVAPSAPPTFVLADPAREYVVYFEQGGTLLLDLLEATGKVQVTWFNPRTGVFSASMQIEGGAYSPFTAPDTNDWVLYVSRQ